MTVIPDRDVLKLDDAGREVGMLPDSLRQAIHRGSLKATMVEGVWYVSRKHLNDYIAQRPTRDGKARKIWGERRLPRKPEQVSYRNWSIFRQYVREDKTYDEIARPLNITAEAVRKIILRVLAVLGDPDDDPDA